MNSQLLCARQPSSSSTFNLCLPTEVYILHLENVPFA